MPAQVASSAASQDAIMVACIDTFVGTEHAEVVRHEGFPCLDVTGGIDGSPERTWVIARDFYGERFLHRGALQRSDLVQGPDQAPEIFAVQRKLMIPEGAVLLPIGEMKFQDLCPHRGRHLQGPASERMIGVADGRPQ